MSESFSLIIAAALLGALLLFAVKLVLTARALDKDPDEFLDESSGSEACPTEILERIFSSEDQEFIHALKSRSLEQLFDKQRSAVALLWVRQTASGIHQVMREHVEAARRTADLHVATEIGLFLRYSQLMLICGALIALIRLAGPLWVRGLAGYAQRLSQNIAHAQQALAVTGHSRADSLQVL